MPLASPPGPGRYIPYGDLQAIRRSPLGALARLAQRYGDVLNESHYVQLEIHDDRAFVNHVEMILPTILLASVYVQSQR